MTNSQKQRLSLKLFFIPYFSSLYYVLKYLSFNSAVHTFKQNPFIVLKMQK